VLLEDGPRQAVDLRRLETVGTLSGRYPAGAPDLQERKRSPRSALGSAPVVVVDFGTQTALDAVAPLAAGATGPGSYSRQECTTICRASPGVLRFCRANEHYDVESSELTCSA
jgi:hypothetical protein